MRLGPIMIQVLAWTIPWPIDGLRPAGPDCIRLGASRTDDILSLRRGEILKITRNAPARGNAASDELIIRPDDLLENERDAH